MASTSLEVPNTLGNCQRVFFPNGHGENWNTRMSTPTTPPFRYAQGEHTYLACLSHRIITWLGTVPLERMVS